MFWIAFLLAQAAVTPQIERGESLFFEAAKGCATCHAMKGRGTAVGPDLKGIGGLAPQAIAMAIRSTVSQYVQNVKLKSGESFPAMPGTKDEKTLQLYDLSKTPPELRKVEQTDVASMTGTDSWKHPPGISKYTNEQLADIIAYVRYAAIGSRKSVDPEEVR
jgi:mono/diheme cytochrome c family protein